MSVLLKRKDINISEPPDRPVQERLKLLFIVRGIVVQKKIPGAHVDLLLHDHCIKRISKVVSSGPGRIPRVSVAMPNSSGF